MLSARPRSDYDLENALYGALRGSLGDPTSVVNIFQQTQAAGGTPISGADALISTDFTSSTISMVSDDAADAAAGTGARTVQITGVDANNAIISEILTLNGVTPVVSVQSFKHINSGKLLTAGSGNSAAGLIVFSKGSSEVGGIPIGFTHITTSTFMVPAGKVAFPNAVLLLPTLASATIGLVKSIRNSDPVTQRIIGMTSAGTTTLSDLSPTVIPAAHAEMLAGDIVWFERAAAGLVQGYLSISLRDA